MALVFWSVISLLTSILESWDQQTQDSEDYEIGKQFNICANPELMFWIRAKNAFWKGDCTREEAWKF